MAEDKLLSTGQAAKLLSVTPDTVLKWIKRSRIPALRTAGGHYRVSREDIERLIQQRSQESVDPPRGLVYCWEYYANRNEGLIQEQCQECVVFRARALRCFEMSDLPPEAGYSGTFCKTSCEDCPYYQELTTRPFRVLVVTDSVQLRDRLRAERDASRLKIEFATCEYEVSMIVDKFKPEYVVLDCSLPDETCAGLCTHLAMDPRVPGVRVIMATMKGTAESGADRNSVVGAIRRPFSLVELEQYIAGSRGLAEEEKIAANSA